MKKLICILLVIATIMNLGVPIFADNNFLSSIRIRPKHNEPMPGSDSLYYGYIDLNEDFNKDILSYTAIVEHSVTNVKIEATCRGSCNVVGAKEYNLVVGKNEIKLVVSQSGSISKTYTITITRKQNPDDDNNLTSLSIIDDSKNMSIQETPKFNSEIQNYYANVENDVSKVNITCMTANENLICDDYILNPGDNKIEIPVISKSGIKKVYTININREKCSDNSFLYLGIEEYDKNNTKIGNEEIRYSSDPKNLVKNVSYDVSSINISVSYLQFSNIKIIGGGSHSLEVGTNIINITIEAENGDTKVYPVTINRLKPSAKLESLQINEYLCGTEQNSFTLDVNYSTKKVNILGVAENISAKVTGNGNYNLKVGTNKFTITVKAADGTIKKYPIVVNRLKQKNVKVLIIWTILD